ncbi:MAG: EscU/YscU/HrcU family type III secretion system export apparatus switch protein [Desulfocapsaceae bacterium]|nr:EscU/YscU/HrcU family type III secretion system export apparatus switch protein [Desulfocapsaceae bacterium]
MNKEKTLEKAVAILYDDSKNTAPQVIASGKGVIARNIIETARKAGIHIQEDPNLIELLSKVPIGDEIPVELYQTVAEMLAFVYRINNTYREKREKLRS